MDILKKITLFFVVANIWIAAFGQINNQNNKNLNQRIYANIDVSKSLLNVTDTLFVPKTYFETGEGFEFKLNSNLLLEIVNDLYINSAN